jgi:hypothetical protein
VLNTGFRHDAAMPRGGGERAHIMRRGVFMPEIEGGFSIDSASRGFADGAVSVERKRLCNADHDRVAGQKARERMGDGALFLGAK